MAAQATRRLSNLVADAGAAGFVGTELEARLALAEAEMISGDRDAAAAQFGALDKDASARGYRLIAQETSAARTSKDDAQTAKQ